jgi:hypothetical protein
LPAAPALLFTLDAAAPAGVWLDTLVQFFVSTPLGVTIESATATMSGASASGDGVVTLIEDLCFGDAFVLGPGTCFASSTSLILFATELDALLADAAAVPSVTLLGVVADFGIDGGLAGSASLGSVLLSFATTATAPEPPANALALLALVVAIAATRRTRAAAR